MCCYYITRTSIMDLTSPNAIMRSNAKFVIPLSAALLSGVLNICQHPNRDFRNISHCIFMIWSYRNRDQIAHMCTYAIYISVCRAILEVNPLLTGKLLHWDTNRKFDDQNSYHHFKGLRILHLVISNHSDDIFEKTIFAVSPQWVLQ